MENSKTVPKAAIYTKKGDKGFTSLVDGQLIPKFHPRVEAYGDVDELNSVIGVLKQALQNYSVLNELSAPLFKIQNHLFNIGSLLACEKEEILVKLPALGSAQIEWLEKQIDHLNQPLPRLTDFILPGGHEASAWAHMARTVCRRAERKTAQLAAEPSSSGLYKDCLIYLNRLSDYFFTMARWIHLKTQTPEIKWNSEVELK
jgi:cob(I)alamin adenosyltransferase